MKKKQTQNQTKKNKSKDQESGKYRYVLFIVLTIIILAILFFTIKINLSEPIVDINKINYTINVSDYVGINLDTDKLHFGTLSPGGDGSRKITINSDLEGYVFITSARDDLIYVDRQGVKLTDKPIHLDFIAAIPRNMSNQNIEGTLTFYVLKTSNPWPLFFQKEKLLQTRNLNSKPSITLNISD